MRNNKFSIFSSVQTLDLSVKQLMHFIVTNNYGEGVPGDSQKVKGSAGVHLSTQVYQLPEQYR